ncbi:NADH-quinone oxidoreductase subunit NuoE [Rhodococcus sp. NPDC003382]
MTRAHTTGESAVPANRPEPVFVELGRTAAETERIEHPGAPRTYPPDVRERLEADAAAIIARYPVTRSALIPLLHLVQAEDGYITPAGIEFCAAQLALTGAEVAAVATFYSMYRRRPTGDYHVGVCTNTLCAIMGGDAILEALAEHLGVDPGSADDTTPDGKITLDHIECNAACDFAPVVMVNWEFFDNQTPDSATALVDALWAGKRITPTRGASLCTFRETARILAGFPDERPGANDSAAPGDATLAGLRVARERNMRAPEATGTEGK